VDWAYDGYDAGQFHVLWAKAFQELNDRNELVDVQTAAAEATEESSDAPTTSAKAAEADDESSDDESSDDSLPLERVVARKTAADSAKEKRTQLHLNKIKNAAKMVKKHDHKRNKVTRDFHLQDLVTVRIPRIDRGGTDFPRLPGMVAKISGHDGEKFFRILTVNGTLNDAYRVSDLEPYVGVVDVNINDLNVKMISLREAAMLQAARTTSTEVINAICNCQGMCINDGRCKCHKLGKKCTSHCHTKKKGVKKCKNC